MEYIDVVNENDNVVGKTTYEDIYISKPLHRIVHIFIWNDKHELLLQKRSKLKAYLPGYYSTSVGGHVQSGETYEVAALRECSEELGIEVMLNNFRRYDYTDHERNIRRFLGIFDASYNQIPEKSEEVEENRYFSLEELKEMINSGEKFHPELLFILKKEFNL